MAKRKSSSSKQSSNQSTDLVGQTIGKFDMVASLGGGGMAEVYKAFQPSLNRHVAIKVIHPYLAKDPEFITRFQREAQNVAALRHPHIVQVYDYDVDEGRPYMVMEFIDGSPLSNKLTKMHAEGQSFTLDEVIRIIKGVGEALAYAHEQEMIHRDVKPANVMIDSRGRVILTDFGLAKIVTDNRLTATGTVMGTPAYMSPEQCKGMAGDGRTDIYSLGVMLYELSTGQLPFQSETQVGLIVKQVTEAPIPPRSVAPHLPEWLEAVILKSLEKDPDARYQSVAQMLADLTGQQMPLTVRPDATMVLPPSKIVPPADPNATVVQPPSTPGRVAMPDLSQLQAEVQRGLDIAKPVLETQWEKVSLRGQELAERMKGQLQTRLEQAAASAAASKRKLVTVLVANTNKYLQAMPDHPIWKLFNDAVVSHGGSIVNRTENGFVATFDTPTSVPETAPRPVNAALELRQKTTQIRTIMPDFKIRFGLHTGFVPLHETSGETVLTAQYVGRAAPPESILISQSTHNLVSNQFTTELVSPISLTEDKTLKVFVLSVSQIR
jgi:serine/threonine protein kinase